MTPYYADDWLTILEGDCREVMATMEPESVHCVVTSPPYWGLRDYGTATWIGGEEGCPHRVPATGSTMNKGNNNREGKPFDVVCGLCGAIREDSQLGLEPTPEAFVANMVAVFREVRRVLRADGTVWLNLGDSYGGMAGNTRGDGAGGGKERGEMLFDGLRSSKLGTRQKDLVGIPWRVAFALQADGWYLRSDIIWSKPNPMPESVTDRPTKAHEYLFLLSKSPRYYYDADAVREPSTGRTDVGRMSFRADIGAGGVWRDEERTGDVSARNLRSVWQVATQPYPGAHFATFPEKLVEPCILAGTSAKGVCPECGAPWVRVVERTAMVIDRSERTHEKGRTRSSGTMLEPPTATTTGWRPTCDRYGYLIHTGPDGRVLQPVPAVTLDPFAGSGTVGRVAARLSRRAVLIDLNAAYLGQAMKRNQDIPLGLETGT